jgi:hypothetical protein
VKAKAKREKAKSLTWWKNKCWDLFSVWIRTKDADENGYVKCYTCETVKHWKEMQAGHAIGGRHNAVLLDEEIVKTQCLRCNVFLRGNYGEFALRLIMENSAQWYERKRNDSKREVKISRADYEEKIKWLKEQIGES